MLQINVFRPKSKTLRTKRCQLEGMEHFPRGVQTHILKTWPLLWVVTNVKLQASAWVINCQSLVSSFSKQQPQSWFQILAPNNTFSCKEQTELRKGKRWRESFLGGNETDRGHFQSVTRGNIMLSPTKFSYGNQYLWDHRYSKDFFANLLTLFCFH